MFIYTCEQQGTGTANEVQHGTIAGMVMGGLTRDGHLRSIHSTVTRWRTENQCYARNTVMNSNYGQYRLAMKYIVMRRPLDSLGQFRAWKDESFGV